jgi:hypothetical protein
MYLKLHRPDYRLGHENTHHTARGKKRKVWRNLDTLRKELKYSSLQSSIKKDFTTHYTKYLT